MSEANEAVLDAIQKQELVSLAKGIVEIPSPAGREEEVVDYILDWLDAAGIKTVKQEIEPGRANAVGKLPGAASGSGRSLMFNGHIDTGNFGKPDEDYLIYADTVPSTEVRQEGDLLFGAGMLNDKGPTAATLIAAKAIHDAGIELEDDLYVTAVSGEIGKAPVDEYQGPEYRGLGIGARYLVNHGVTADYAIVSENSGWGIGYALPGVLYLKVTLHGIPQYVPNIDYRTIKDDHALHKATAFLDHFHAWAMEYTAENAYEHECGLVEPIANIGAMRGGHPAKPNYQPGVAQLFIDIRVPPNRTPQDVRREATRMIHRFDEGAEVDAYFAQKGYAPSRDDDEALDHLVETVERSYESVFDERPPDMQPAQTKKWNDNNIFVESGIPTVKIAPGHPGSHAESSIAGAGVISATDLLNAARVYAACALSICGVAE